MGRSPPMCMIPTVCYISPFVPPEWIAAHGLEPRRLALDGTRGAVHGAGVCPFAAALGEYARNMADGEALVLTTTCDQMRRMAEQIDSERSRVFLMNIPATWQTAGARQLYLDELHRLGRFLCQMGGRSYEASRLADIMREYDARRRLQLAGSQVHDACGRVRLAVVGGMLRRQDYWIFECIERAGGWVVLDATKGGHRTQPASFDLRRLDEDPVAELVHAYFDTIPDVFRRPDTLLHDYLRRQIEERGVRGIILVRYLWCDQWHAQYQRLKEATGLPVVEVDLGGQDRDSQRARTRIESLVSILQ